MKFPEYSSIESPPLLVQDYVSALGSAENELAFERYEKRPLLHISQLLGQACMRLAAGTETDIAEVLLRRAYRLASQDVIDPAERDTEYFYTKLHGNAAQLITHRGNPRAVEQFRTEQHFLVGRALRWGSDVGNRGLTTDAKAEWRGFMAEMTVLGLLTRYRHPWLLAMLALRHHDKSQVGLSNYDLLLVEHGLANSQPEMHKVQVKSACIGACENREVYEQTELYQPGITLVSAHCDLGTPRHNLYISRLLRGELNDRLNTADLRKLDGLSNHLLMAITGDPKRQGTRTRQSGRRSQVKNYIRKRYQRA